MTLADEKKEVTRILKHLEPHCPFWVQIVRRYIRYLERKSCGK